MRHQPLVPAPPPRPERFSQTLLALGDKCLRAAYLSLLHDGGAPSHDMARGSLFHSFAERAMWTLIETDQPNLYGATERELAAEFEAQHDRLPNVAELDVLTAKARSAVADHTAEIVDELLREEPWLQVPQADVDDVREMAYHWAVGYDVNPALVHGLELKFLLPVGGATVSGKVDVLWSPGPGLVCVDDYKTSFWIPSREDIERDFQLKLYAAMVAFGRPVEKVPCPACESFEPQEPGQPVNCDACDGRRYHEQLGEPLGAGVNVFRLRQVFPRYLGDDGFLRSRPGRDERPLEISRTDLHDFLADVERDVAKFEAAFESGRWDAVPGSHCDTFCPAAWECPLPANTRGRAGSVTSLAEAQEALELIEVEKARHAQVLKAVRGFAKENAASVRAGRDLVYEWRDEEKRETDWDALQAEVEAALVTGRSVDWSRARKTRVSTSFRRRRLTKAELAGEGGQA